MLLNNENQRYEIGGVDVLEIAAEYGTPLFVYDASKIIEQYQKMEQALAKVKKVKI